MPLLSALCCLFLALNPAEARTLVAGNWDSRNCTVAKMYKHLYLQIFKSGNLYRPFRQARRSGKRMYP